MSAYRYIVFPPGAAPTAEELATLRRFAEQLGNHIALGAHRRDGGLAIAFDAEPFDRLRGLEPAFEELLTHWRARGGDVAEKLPFVKDSKLWKAIEHPPKSIGATTSATKKGATKEGAALKVAPSNPTEREHEAPDKRLTAREAEGRSRLAAAQMAARSEQLERAAGWMPYVLWGLGAAMVLAAGGYFGSRLLASPSERRSETVERVADDPIGQALVPALPAEESVAEE